MHMFIISQILISSKSFRSVNNWLKKIHLHMFKLFNILNEVPSHGYLKQLDIRGKTQPAHAGPIQVLGLIIPLVCRS